MPSQRDIRQEQIDKNTGKVDFSHKRTIEDMQTVIKSIKQKSRQNNVQRDKRTEKQKEKQTCLQTDKNINRQIHKQTNT